MEKFTNSLSKESSPYLLQHAHNPVNWVAWTPDVFERAKNENKLVLISIGYSACHWCHVMEHESFENEEVAELMNKHFINIKVDREERPDVDQVYMNAVQIMTQKGGWPLNCFVLPDGRPIYGGTYFPKEQWMQILDALQHTFANDLPKVEEYAAQLHSGVQQSELIDDAKEIPDFEAEKIHELFNRWSKSFDDNDGGATRAPKFPLPSNYEFLLYYGFQYKHKKTLQHVELTLDKMALGGIYDQIGGGFSRYSVDMLWKVPHFEKMLYDNGQLISLYSNAYNQLKKPLYKRIVYQTIEWLQREMLHSEGSYFAALDADSEGEEGKFYCWKKDEFDAVLDKDANWVKDFYTVNQRGYWEEGKYIPLRTESDKEFAKKMNWSHKEFEKNVYRINEKLLKERTNRIRPGLDDKCLTSWNALLLKGFCDAYKAFNEAEFLLSALKIGRWISNYQIHESGTLWRTRKNGKSTIEGFLEDYSTTIQGFIALYEITFDSEWLEKAKRLLQFTILHFQHSESKMFYFTSDSTELIARKMELNDNVIPASNSIMANNLLTMSSYYSNSEWKADAKQMLASVYDGMEMYGSGYSNWGILALKLIEKHYDVVIDELGGKHLQKDLFLHYLPNCTFAGGNSELPVLIGKSGNKNLIYVCFEGTCLRPTNEVEEVLEIVLT